MGIFVVQRTGSFGLFLDQLFLNSGGIGDLVEPVAIFIVLTTRCEWITQIKNGFFFKSSTLSVLKRIRSHNLSIYMDLVILLAF